MAGFTLVHLDDVERNGNWALLRRALGLGSFGMAHVEIEPGKSIPEHDETQRDQEEVFVVLSGAPTIVIDGEDHPAPAGTFVRDRKSTRLNSSHISISYAVFCLKKKRR